MFRRVHCNITQVYWQPIVLTDIYIAWERFDIGFYEYINYTCWNMNKLFWFYHNIKVIDSDFRYRHRTCTKPEYCHGRAHRCPGNFWCKVSGSMCSQTKYVFISNRLWSDIMIGETSFYGNSVKIWWDVCFIVPAFNIETIPGKMIIGASFSNS